MFVRFVCGLVVLSGAAGLLAAPVPKGAGPPPAYYPTGAGAEWVYDRNGIEDDRFSTTAAERDKNTVTVSIKNHSIPFGACVYPKMVVSGEGLRQEDGWLLKTGLASGSSWKGPGDITRTVYGPEEVQTKAGKFKALRVEWIEGHTTHVVWYAPDIGEVKSVIKRCGETIPQRNLRSFTPPKDK